MEFQLLAMKVYVAANNECVLFQNLTNLDRSRLRRDRYSPVKKNAERFARIDLDLSDFEKERTQCRCLYKMAVMLRSTGLGNSYFTTHISKLEVGVLGVSYLEIRLPTSMERYFLLGNL